jgi:hypothetical protein
MRRMVSVGGVIATLLTSLLVSSPASAVGFLDLPSPPPTDKIVIDVITVNGSGCPAGTAAIAVSPDNTAFTVTYSNYMAQVGVGSVPTDFRKNCQINVIVHVPAGFTYAVASVDYRGFASIAAGATATERANYYFQGSPVTTSVVHSIPGPLADDWQRTDTLDVASLVFAPCGALRNLNINTELRMSAGSSNTRTTTSFITMDSTDGSLQTIYHFAWQRCPR